jgi:hypothetical protein
LCRKYHLLRSVLANEGILLQIQWSWKTREWTLINQTIKLIHLTQIL